MNRKPTKPEPTNEPAPDLANAHDDSQPSVPTAPAPRARGKRKRLDLKSYVTGVLAGDRAVLGRAITLVESHARRDQALAQQLLVELLPHTGKAYRVGITGVPGVGKSTLIEALGSNLTRQGHRVAVLAIDPTSRATGGSILGDKTRMTRLSRDPQAFVRPSPAAGSLGGVARKTRETMLVCEAAGFDVVIVETVGVGQSETSVAEMVDFFLLLMLANAGDELQGIKRGIIELADLIAINKAERENAASVRQARREYMSALRLMHGSHPDWRPSVIAVSGLHNEGLDALWAQVVEHRALLERTGHLESRRKEQTRRWMWTMVEERLMRALREHPAVAALAPEIERSVLAGQVTPALGAEALLQAFGLPTT